MIPRIQGTSNLANNNSQQRKQEQKKKKQETKDFKQVIQDTYNKSEESKR